MARYKESVCRLCRREKEKLFLKGDRCFKDRCAVDRRAYPPGEHGPKGKARKGSEYALQLREKQKVKRIYGLLERQFHGYFIKAERQKGITGENLLKLLERRLDNIIYRFGFAHSRNEARQLVRQGHFMVNNRKVNIPSYLVKADDVVELMDKSKKLLIIKDAVALAVNRGIPSWLELDEKKLKGIVKTIPSKEELNMPIQEQLIVELYSK